MAVRSKVGLSGDGFVEGKPKKLVREVGSTRSMPRLLVMGNVRCIVDKDGVNGTLDT